MNSLLIQISITCLVLQAAAQLLRNYQGKQVLLALLLSITALLQYHFYLFTTQQLAATPNLFMSYVPLLLSIGPLLKLYFENLSQDAPIAQKKNLLHLLLPTWGIYHYWTYVKTDPTVINTLINTLYTEQNISSFFGISLLCSASLIFYGYTILKEQPAFWKKDGYLNKRLLLGWSFINILFIIIMSISIFLVQVSPILIHTGNQVVSLVFISIFLIHLSHPDLFKTWLFEVRKSQRVRKYLGAINPERKLKEIQERMASEKLYADADLSLPLLAETFDLTRYQLSELLNDYAGVGFVEFIGTYRIEGAKKQLITEDWKKTIAIALDNGFNNQSSFNTTFKKFTKMTPSEYRKTHEKAKT